MHTNQEIDVLLAQYNVRFCPHSKSGKMQIIALFAKILGYSDFKEIYWLTLGKTIYHPDRQNPFDFYDLIDHELVHVAQQRKMGILVWVFRYLAQPKFRYLQEREAYLISVDRAATRGAAIERVVDILQTYKTGVPREEMITWFKEQGAT
jgi:hypothetical protein